MPKKRRVSSLKDYCSLGMAFTIMTHFEMLVMKGIKIILPPTLDLLQLSRAFNTIIPMHLIGSPLGLNILISIGFYISDWKASISLDKEQNFQWQVSSARMTSQHKEKR